MVHHRVEVVVVCLIFVNLLVKYLDVHKFGRPRHQLCNAENYDLHTGDLILMDNYFLVTMFTKSIFDHTGVVYCHPNTGQLFLVHVWKENGISLRTNNACVCMHPLYHFLEQAKRKHKKSTVVRRLQGSGTLNTNIFHQLPCSQFDIFACARGLQRRWPALLANSLFDRATFSFGCVEFTTWLYVQLGVFHEEALHQHLWMESYTQQFDKQLPFLSLFHFGPEIDLGVS